MIHEKKRKNNMGNSNASSNVGDSNVSSNKRRIVIIILIVLMGAFIVSALIRGFDHDGQNEGTTDTSVDAINNTGALLEKNEAAGNIESVSGDQKTGEAAGNTESASNDQEVSEADQEVTEASKSLIDPDGDTLQTRILVPDGYERTDEEPSSLGEFLRSYKVLSDNSPVLLFDGTVKSHDNAVCVFDMYLSDNDLQQCADSVMRIYAEYLRACGREDEIAFHFVNGFLCDWSSYKSGKRIIVSGNDVSWTDGGAASDSDDAFEKYLETVYMYASTLSLDKESRPIELSDIRTGDIFIKGGSPGHVVMVVDTCVKDGKKAFLLAQGYMPAQQFHVLKNELHEEDPWYYEDEITYPFTTPEYVFGEPCLKRPVYLAVDWVSVTWRLGALEGD